MALSEIDKMRETSFQPPCCPEAFSRHFQRRRGVVRPRTLMPRAGAFSLIELLVVITIIGILAVLLTVSFRGITNATDMTRASDDVAKAVILASQRAFTFNHQTAISFLRPSNSGNYVAYQIWEQRDSANQSSWQAADPIRFLPTDIVISGNITFSTLLSRRNIAGPLGPFTATAFTAPTGTLWYYSLAYFAPDGSLVASTGQTSITLIGNPPTSTSGLVAGLPPNFAVVDIAPLHSIPTIYRP